MADKKKSSAKARRNLRVVRDKAEEIARDARKTAQLIDQAMGKAEGARGVLDKFWDDLMTLFRMLKSYFSGHYELLPWKTLVMAVGALLYFVNPFDFVPDFLIGTGLLDDATVIALTLQVMRKDLAQFRDWERQRQTE